MSELNDDLLNYELGDIDDQTLYGGDEDELLLSDDEFVGTGVTKDENQRTKSEAEQWIQSLVQEKQNMSNVGESATTSQTTTQVKKVVEPTFASIEATEVTSSATTFKTHLHAERIAADIVSTSVGFPTTVENEFKEPTHKTHNYSFMQTLLPNTSETKISNVDEVSSSCGKDTEMELSAISCSSSLYTDSSFLQSSQESLHIGTGPDPREDYEEEREVRTNIKITNERDIAVIDNEHSPENNQARYIQGKRGGYPLNRPHEMRGGRYNHRPLLRFPYHGQYPQQPPFVLSPTLHNAGSNSGPGSAAGMQPLIINPQNPIHLSPAPDPANPNLLPRLRLPYLGFRPGGPMAFRHPNSGIYRQAPPEYVHCGVGGQLFPANFGPNMLRSLRPMFRGETPGIGNNGQPLGVRMQRPPLQCLLPHNMIHTYVSGSSNPHPSQAHPLHGQPSLQLPIGTSDSAAARPATETVQPQADIGGPFSGHLLPHNVVRPGKILINPNFKGGVQAAANKLLEETQFMSAISRHVSHLQSDEELLRQQEEFIQKNNQHMQLEKRRNESSVRRSRSRTRSRSRERSYSPHNKRDRITGSGVIERQFERERDRGAERYERGAQRFTERDRDRERNQRMGSRERERERERDRELPVAGYRGTRGKRFWRGNSRDRGFGSREGGYYSKRRGSTSPAGNRSSGAGAANRRDGDREKDVVEDEETRAYRVEIEKQKAQREKVFREKEMKRKRLAEEKNNEEKRTTQTITSSSRKSIVKTVSSKPNDEQQQLPQSQKLKPIIITERKIISLKKRQQQQRNETEEQVQQHREHHRHPQQHQSAQTQSQQRKLLPTVKIPDGKRTLADNLTKVIISGEGHCSHNNTAIIRPVVQKSKEDHASRQPPNIISRHTRRLSTPSDDEVELDFNEDELMLEQEDRLLATPSPSPTNLRALRTPTPELLTQNKTKMSASFIANNRRVVLKSSSSSATLATPLSSSITAVCNRNSRDVGAKESFGRQQRRTDSGNSSSNNRSNSSKASRRGIFERLDVRKQQQEAGVGTTDSKRSRGQHILLKDD